MSMGTIEPERISEIVSDIVESQSGTWMYGLMFLLAARLE
jgi:hypothetical protein